MSSRVRFDSVVPYSICVDFFTPSLYSIASFLIILKQHTHFKEFPSRIMFFLTLPQNVSTTRTPHHMSFLATCPGPLCARRKHFEQLLSVFLTTFWMEI